MTPALRKLTLGVLYIAVAVLIALPPVIFLATAPVCEGPDCSMTSRQLFTLDAAVLWLLPFSLAAVLLALAFRLKSRA